LFIYSYMPKHQKKISSDISFNDMDENDRREMEVAPDPNAIPDLDILLEKIQEMLTEIELPAMQEFAKINKKEFEKILAHKYMSDIPLSIINLMLEEQRYEHLERLLNMFDQLRKIKKGDVNIEDAQKNFSEQLNEEYLYKKFGSKENFEKKMTESMNKKT